MQTKTAVPAYTIIILVCCLVFFSPAAAQQKNVIEFKKPHPHALISMKRYYLNDEKISNRKIGELMERENKEAYKVFKDARTLGTIATLVAIPSTILFFEETISFAKAAIDDTFLSKSGTLWLISVGGMICGGILHIVAHSKFKRAIKIYNSGITSTGKIQLKFGITSSGGVGLIASF